MGYAYILVTGHFLPVLQMLLAPFGHPRAGSGSGTQGGGGGSMSPGICCSRLQLAAPIG